MGQGSIGKVINIPQNFEASPALAQAVSEQVKQAAKTVGENPTLSQAKHYNRDVDAIKTAYIRGRTVAANAVAAQLKADKEKLGRLRAFITPSSDTRAQRKLELALKDGLKSVTPYADKAAKMYASFEEVQKKLEKFSKEDSFEFEFGGIKMEDFLKGLESTTLAGKADDIDSETVKTGIKKLYSELLASLQDYIGEQFALDTEESADRYSYEKNKGSYIVTLEDRTYLYEKDVSDAFASVVSQMTVTIDAERKAKVVVQFSNVLPENKVATLATLEKASTVFKDAKVEEVSAA